MVTVTRLVGTIDVPFEKIDNVKLKDHFAYYRNTKLTDDYYIINNVYIADNGELYRTGKHKLYIMGDISEGDFIATSKMHGIGIKETNKDLCFAVAKESYNSYENGKVGLIDVVLL